MSVACDGRKKFASSFFSSFCSSCCIVGTSLSTNSYDSVVSCSKTSADTAVSQILNYNRLVASTESGKLRLADVIDEHVQKALDTNTKSQQQHQQANFSNFNLLSSLLSNAGTATSSSSSSSTSSAICPTETVQKQQQTLKDFKTMQNEYLNRYAGLFG
jgi:hypothetical protein